MSERQIEARHFYTPSPVEGEQKHRTTVVAVINPGVSWSVYMGACGQEGAMTEEEATQHVWYRGAKLAEPIGRSFFPHVEDRYRT